MMSSTSDIMKQPQQHKVFRFKFSNNLEKELENFARNHKDDDRKTFKTQWNQWLTLPNIIKLVSEDERKYNELVTEQKDTLIEKMFFSVRYYYRKKILAENEDDNASTASSSASSEKRKYITVTKTILNAMDQYILRFPDKKPADSFTMFCNENVYFIRKEIELIKKSGITSSDSIYNKIKTTYKNRYYIVSRN